jgi:hypothetical protein
VRCAHEALRLAEEADHPWSRAAAYHALGALLNRQGKSQDSVSILDRGLRLCEANDLSAWRTTLAWELGCAYALDGNAAQSRLLLEQSIQQAATERRVVHQSLRMGRLAEAELLAGQTERAAKLADDALHLARLRRERPAEAHILRILGDVAMIAAPKNLDWPLARYREALSVAQQLGMQPLQARCHDALARLFAQHHDSERAAAESRAAEEMFNAMGIAPCARATSKMLGELRSA